MKFPHGGYCSRLSTAGLSKLSTITEPLSALALWFSTLTWQLESIAEVAASLP